MSKEQEEEKVKKSLFMKIKEHKRAAILNTIFSLFFNLLPFWIGVLITLSTNKWTGWKTFYLHGEFYLYSTSLIASAYLIYNNNKIRKADLNTFFSIISLIFIVVVSVLYSAIASNDNTPLVIFTKWASIFSIMIAVPLFYYAQIISNKRSPNVGKQRHNEQQTIIDGIHG